MALIRTFAQVQQKLGVCLLVPQPTADNAAALAASALLDTFVFQYFPESLQDTQSANYQSIDIPGGSHPLYQWTSGGAREISLRTMLVSERIVPPGAVDVTNRNNVDINGAIAALRYFLYPDYDPVSAIRARPPLRLWLIIPGTLLRSTFIPALPVILTNLSVNITSWHGAGIPRTAEVDMQLSETVQSGTGGVKFVGRSNFNLLRRLYTPLSMAARRGPT